MVVPATNRVFHYQPYTDGQSSYSTNAYGNYGNGGQQFNNNQQAYGQSNNGYEANANNGAQVKTRRYQIRRPAIKKEFYDIEEKVVIRPAGSALIELDTPISETLKQDSYAPAYNGQNQYNAGHAYTPNRNQFNAGQAYNQNQNQNQVNAGQGYNQNQVIHTGGQGYNPYQNQFIIGQGNPRGIICGHHGQVPNQYQPTTTHLTPTTVTYQPTTPGQYYPTTTTTPGQYYPTTTTPSRTYQPPYNDQNTNQYHPTTFAPISSETSTRAQTVSPSDVFVSSTTPISVTIVDTADSDTNNQNNNTQRQDIIYARGQSNYGNNQYNGNDENEPDQFRNELPPRGDVGQTADYRETDQFFHELPRSRYTGPYQPPAVHVETKYNGEPTETNYYAEEITIGNRGQNSSRNGNNSTDQQQRLIELYTGNGGVTEIGQTGEQQQQQQKPRSGQYTNDGSSSYNDVGNVRARVISATPAPEGSQPSEHVNTRRIVVSKRVETIREVDVPENNATASTNNGNFNGQTANYNANYNDNSNDDQRQYTDDNSNYNSNYNNNNDGRFAGNNNNNYNANYNDGRSSSNYENNAEYSNNNNNDNDGRTSDSSSRYSTPSTPSGYYISTTPASTGKRVIYVKPVTQEFAEQKAVAPAQNDNQRRL